MMSETPQFSLDSKDTVHPIASPLGEWSCVALSGVEEPMGPIYCSSLIATPGSFTIMLCRMLLFCQSYQNRSFNPHIHFGDVQLLLLYDTAGI